MWSSRGMAVTSMKPLGLEVMAKAARRKFSAEYKLQVLREADTCTKAGQIGALLR
jgi:hypothetical protein